MRSLERACFAGRAASCTLAMLIAAGCSPATHYYTLAPVNGGESVAPTRMADAAVIAVGPVMLPDYTDRPQIVVRTGPHTVDQATFEQWGGDLDDMVPRVLVEDLAERMPGDHLVSFPQVGDLAFDFRVPINISQFDVSSSGEAVIVARWQVHPRPGSGEITVHESVTRAQASGKGYDERVAALSRALGDLTSDIAKALAPLPRGEAAKAEGKPAGKAAKAGRK